MDFVLNNWYLFVALAIILVMLFAGNIGQMTRGIKEINCSRAVQLMNHDNAVVLDVGEAKEYEAGHIPGAINLPAASLAGRLSELEKHKSKPVIVNCQNSQRAQKVAITLSKNGFGTVYQLAGGMNAWKRDNLPVEK